MSFKIFTEKQVRRAILNKIDPNIKSTKAKHWSGKIYLNEKYLTTVKIPNSHKKDFGRGKAKNVARQLLITEEQYNELIECTFSGSDYYSYQEKCEIDRNKDESK